MFPLCQLVDDVLNMRAHRRLVLRLLSTKTLGQKRQQVGVRNHRCSGCLDGELLSLEGRRRIGGSGRDRRASSSSIVQKTGQICWGSGLRGIRRWKRLLRHSCGHRRSRLQRRQQRLQGRSVQRRDHVCNIRGVRQGHRLLWHWRRWKRRDSKWCRGRKGRRRASTMGGLCVEDNLRSQVRLEFRVFLTESLLAHGYTGEQQ